MRRTAGVTTICIADQHKIRKFDATQYNRAPQASEPEVLKACTQMKELAPISNDQSAQIIINVMATKYWVDAKVSADFLKNGFKRCSATMDAWFSCI